MRLLHLPIPPFYLGLAAACDTCGQAVDFDKPGDVRIGSPGTADTPATYAWTCPTCYCVNLRAQERLIAESRDFRAALATLAPGAGA